MAVTSTARDEELFVRCKTCGFPVAAGLRLPVGELEVTGLGSHVVGIDDADRGQIVAALVRSPEPIDVDELRTRLRERLSAYKVPRRIVVVPDDQVPMMSSGKVDLRGLKAVLGG